MASMTIKNGNFTFVDGPWLLRRIRVSGAYIVALIDTRTRKQLQQEVMNCKNCPECDLDSRAKFFEWAEELKRGVYKNVYVL